jgi:disulfide bond formation protein DsbB
MARRRARPDRFAILLRTLAPRTLNLAGFLVCAALLAFALYSQFQLNLEPCPLCIFQRIGVAFTAVWFLVAAAHNPKGRGRTAYAVLIALGALATAAVAARHVYVQHLPPGSLPSCGAPLAILLKFTPVFTLIKKVLTGSGECGEVSWRFLGLAMPAWVLLWALALGWLGLYANLRRAGSRAL